MNITVNITEEHRSKPLYDAEGEKVYKMALPYCNNIFAKVGCETEEIEISDMAHDINFDLGMFFKTSKNIDDICTINMQIVLLFLTVAFRNQPPDDKRTLKIQTAVEPELKPAALKLFTAISQEKELERFNFYKLSINNKPYKDQLPKLFNECTGYFEKSIKICEEIVAKLLSEGNPDFLSSVKSVEELFVFN